MKLLLSDATDRVVEFIKHEADYAELSEFFQRVSGSDDVEIIDDGKNEIVSISTDCEDYCGFFDFSPRLED